MADPQFIDYYKLIGVEPGSPIEDVDRACIALAERIKNDPTQTKTFEQIERAYEVLSHPEKRQTYDCEYFDQQIRALKAADASSPELVKRDGILIVALAIAITAVVSVAAVISDWSDLKGSGYLDAAANATFRLFSYGENEGLWGPGRVQYLIEIDAITIYLVCFLFGLYGVLVLLKALPRPITVWTSLKNLICPSDNGGV